MIIEKFNSYKEAEERANALLLSDSVDYPTLTTTERKIELHAPECYVASIEDKKSGNIAIIKRAIISKRIGDDWNSPEAWTDVEEAELLYISSSDEVIYPFRNLDLYSLVFAYMMRGTHNPFIKPAEDITIEEALTVAGELKLRYFFGYGGSYDNEIKTLSQIKAGELDLWEEWEEEDGTTSIHLATYINRPLLTSVTGKEIKSLKDCIAAIAELSGNDLSKEEAAQVREEYDYNQQELFLFYCIYTFLRSEKYSDLKKALSNYKKFGLNKNWSENFFMLEGETPEYYIISRYFDSETFKFLSVTTLRELAKYTEIPLPLLLECSSEISKNRMIRKRYKSKLTNGSE